MASGGVSSSYQLDELTIDSELKKHNHVRVPIIPDGHCIVRAFFKILTNEHCYPLKSYVKLLHCACNEIEDNLPFYSDKITSGTNVSGELDEYKKERNYNKNIVDLIVYALANSTESTVLIYYVHEGVIKTHEIPPTRDGRISKRCVTLARVGEHYDAVLNADTFKRINENTVTISNSPVKRQNTDVFDLSDSEYKSPKEVKLDLDYSDSDSSATEFARSGASDSSNDSGLESRVPRKVSVNKLTPQVWADVPVTKCTALPPDIDGTAVYELPFEPSNRMRSSVDGRKWNRYMSSKRTGFKGIRRLAHCAGSFHCKNSFCDFRKQWGPNTVHFDKKNNCKFCGMAADYIPCKARKVWEFNDARKTVAVYHHGYHTCPVVVKNTSEVALAALKEKFEANPTLKPQKAVNTLISDAIKQGQPWEAIEDLTDSILSPSLPKNVKQKVRKELHPYGHSFEAVQTLKTSLDEKDPLYIFEVHDNRFNSEKPTLVFSTSTDKMKLAATMARDKELSHKFAFCFFDAKHGRVQGMKTMTASVFHCGLRRMVRLAVMHCEHEDASNVALFWHLFNKALKVATNNPQAVFNPFGYMMDEGGAEWAGLLEAGGQEEVKNAKSCQFHFKQAVNREAGKLKSSNSKFQFKRLANSMLVAKTTAAYDKAYGDMAKFIHQKPSKRGILKSWLDWWDERKHHVFDAFRTLPFTPTTNLSECLHSSWETTQSSKMSLIDVIYDDVADSVKFARHLKLIGDGSLAPSPGVSHFVREARERELQRRKAVSYGQELTAYSNLTLHRDAKESNPFKVDPKCTHRHDKRARNSKSVAKKDLTTRKSAYDESTSNPSDLSSSSSDELPNKEAPQISESKKRGGRFRKNRSKQFQKNLAKAKHQASRISVMKSRNIDKLHRVYVVSSAQVEDHSSTYEVNISQEPSCSCPQGLKAKKEICKHIVWVYLFVLGVPETSCLLNQVHLTQEETRKILDEVPPFSSVTGTFTESCSTEQTAQQDITSQLSKQICYQPASEANDRNPFLLKFLEPNVKVCAGCPRPNNTFRPDGVDLLPPYNVVICHKEIRQWRENGEVRQSPVAQNTYYHADISCIRKNNPTFQKNMVVIPPSVKKDLKQEHKLYLHQHFDFDL